MSSEGVQPSCLPIHASSKFVGAGDAFNAGLLVGLDRMEAKSRERLSSLPVTQLEGAVTFATAFATDTVTRPGSNPPWNFKV